MHPIPPYTAPAKPETDMAACAAILLLFFSMAACAMSPYDKSAVEALINGPNPPTYHQYEIVGRSMHYAAVGDPQKPLIVFVHGTPGSWEAFAGYMADDRLIQRAYMVSVDRAGFGKSGYKQMVLSLEQQAAMLVPAIRQNQPHGGAILIGHSLGGAGGDGLPGSDQWFDSRRPLLGSCIGATTLVQSIGVFGAGQLGDSNPVAVGQPGSYGAGE